MVAALDHMAEVMQLCPHVIRVEPPHPTAMVQLFPRWQACATSEPACGAGAVRGADLTSAA